MYATENVGIETILFLTEIVIYKITADIDSLIEWKIECESGTESDTESE